MFDLYVGKYLKYFFSTIGSQKRFNSQEQLSMQDGMSLKKIFKHLFKMGCVLRCHILSHYVGAGANPMIMSYNASAVKNFNTLSSLMFFQNKNIFCYFQKTLYSLQR
jgi:hypothetical protein